MVNLENTHHAQVIRLSTNKVFTLEEVDELFPIIRRITQEYASKVQALVQRFEILKKREDLGLSAVEKEINTLVQVWQSKIERLGAQTKGLWIVDFDSGSGFYCWKYPEEQVNFWHAYQNGYSGRVRVERKIQSPEVTIIPPPPPA